MRKNERTRFKRGFKSPGFSRRSKDSVVARRNEAKAACKKHRLQCEGIDRILANAAVVAARNYRLVTKRRASLQRRARQRLPHLENIKRTQLAIGATVWLFPSGQPFPNYLPGKIIAWRRRRGNNNIFVFCQHGNKTWAVDSQDVLISPS
jgi:hypothetical protein